MSQTLMGAIAPALAQVALCFHFLPDLIIQHPCFAWRLLCAQAVVIGAALALSSSAFVLQLLNERAEMSTKFGAATLGILLLQASVTLAQLPLSSARPWLTVDDAQSCDFRSYWPIPPTLSLCLTSIYSQVQAFRSRMDHVTLLPQPHSVCTAASL